MSAEFDYGNARLRARKSALFDRSDYERLLGKDLEGLLGALAATPYGPEVEESLTRARGRACLHRVLRTHLGRTLNEMRGFYQGRSGEQVGHLVGRWDLRNILTVLRGSASHTPPEEILGLLVPTGSLDESVLRELVQQTDLRATVDLLVAWGVPQRATAHALLRAWPTYQQTHRLAALERALHVAHAATLDRALDPADPQDALLRRVLLAEVDQLNILTALRLWTARTEGEVWQFDASQADPFLPGGNVAVRALRAAVQAPSRELALQALQGALDRRLRDALASWERDGDLSALADRLEEALTRLAVSFWWAEDPSGIGAPVAFVWAKENEARNLRILGIGGDDRVPPQLLRDRLVVL